MTAPRRALFMTQRLDAQSPMFAAAVAKAEAIAARVDELVVVGDSVEPASLPANGRARTFGAGSRAGRGARFARAIASELRPRPVIAIAHMVPLYAVLAAPLLRPARVPIVLRLTHWDNRRVLRLAARVSTALTSVDERSFPFSSPKLEGTGHGIDPRQFPCFGAERRGECFTALVAGRYARHKGLDEVLRALRILLDRGVELRVVMHGPTMSPDEVSTKRALGQLAGELDLGSALELGEVMPRDELPELFASVDVLICNHISPDKIVYEAAASCLPVLVSHPAFDELVEGIEPGLLFDHADPASLADRLGALMATSPEARRTIGETLRERVEARHSVDTWAEAMLAYARDGRWASKREAALRGRGADQHA